MIMKILIDDVTAIILAGGESSRMRRNKSLLKLGNETIIEIISELMTKIFSKVVISTNEPERYKFLNSPIVKDIYKNCGPLSGIHAGLSQVANDRIFVITCDMPFISQELITHLLNVKSSKQIIIPKADERIQYLCGVYCRSVFPEAERTLSSLADAVEKNEKIKKTEFSLQNFVKKIGAEMVDVEKESFFFKDLFFNINLPEDFEYAKIKLEK